MIRTCHQNKDSVVEKVKAGQLDMIAQGQSDFVDDMFLDLNRRKIFDCFDLVEDKRAKNSFVPFKPIIINSVAGKAKNKITLKDIPVAITDHRLLGELNVSLIDPDGELNKRLMCDSNIRHIIGMYDIGDWIRYYNQSVQDHLMKHLDIVPNIFILDTTYIPVHYWNKNYEGAEVTRDKKTGKLIRGYKLAVLRAIVGNTGIVVEIKLASIKDNDNKICEDILKNSSMLKPGDIIIMDRGFISRKNINHLKAKRGVDIYIPLKKNMEAYKEAVKIANENRRWADHPTRHHQKIAFVSNLKDFWRKNKKEDVDFNACVVWDTTDGEYYVFISSDLTINARQIVKTYTIRTEIEEDFRQLKEQWQLTAFRSTKLPTIEFHISCTLWGYLFFQIFLLLNDNPEYYRKSLPTLIKNYKAKITGYYILFCAYEFGIFSTLEYSELLISCVPEIQIKILAMLKKFNLG